MVEEFNLTHLQTEEIPDENRLFMRVHQAYIRDGLPTVGAFTDHGEGMSTDWDKYSTAQETLQRSKDVQKNGVVEMIVGAVRGLGQRVAHAPIPTNRAHTAVLGEKDTEVRVKLRRVSNWVIPLMSS